MKLFCMVLTLIAAIVGVLTPPSVIKGLVFIAIGIAWWRYATRGARA